MIQFFRKTKFQDKETTQLQDNVGLVLNQIAKKALIDGVQLKDVALESGSNRINHKLGRQPEGWVIVDRNGTATVYRTAWDANTLTFTSSAAVTISLWVF